jgi:hypothetical protein
MRAKSWKLLAGSPGNRAMACDDPTSGAQAGAHQFFGLTAGTHSFPRKREPAPVLGDKRVRTNYGMYRN